VCCPFRVFTLALLLLHTYAAMSNHLEFVFLVALWVFLCVLVPATVWRVAIAMVFVVYLVLRCWLQYRETRNSWSVYSNSKRD
jgi:predicted membrane protein